MLPQCKKGPTAADWTGRTFGKLTVLRFLKRDKNVIWWECQCECGTVKAFRANNLSQNSKSCGCTRKTKEFAEQIGNRTRRHGKSKTRIYWVWLAMHQRCTNPNVQYYENYGGRGIKVCKRWDKFENFYADMGDPPPGLTLDRENNNGNYTPTNCRWADRSTQTKNSRRWLPKH